MPTGIDPRAMPPDATERREKWAFAPRASLRGRHEECQLLDALVGDVRAGRSRALVVRGEAGVGKTALLDYLSTRLSGCHVTLATGVESEMELAYSGLHQLVTPLFDRVDQLPTPQRDALKTVFGLMAGPVPDPFLVGLSTLTLLAETAEGKPLVCIIDDAQWLDHASSEALAFVARRLLAERIGIVAAVRAGIGDDTLRGLPELLLRGLDDSDARALLLANAHGPIDEAIGDRIVFESNGNPLALLELPRTWGAPWLAGGFAAPAATSVAARVQHSFTRRLADLPAETRLVVLAAAAEPTGDRVLLHRAVEVLGLDMGAASPAVDAGLLRLLERVQFAHPLVRSAAYRSARTEDRRRVHRALAQVTDPDADPDRRAWHRALATVGLDEDVAADLERSAGRAQSRGGLAAAAAFLSRAAEVTPDPAARVRRALDAAFVNVTAGAFDTARALLSTIRAGQLDEMQSARADLLAAQLALASSRGNAATPLLLAAAARLEGLDARLARGTYLDAFSTAHFGGRLNERIGVRDVALAARKAAAPSAEPTVADHLLAAYIALEQDYRLAVPVCRTALQALRREDLSLAERLRHGWHGIVISLELWDDESAHHISEQYLELARKTGALAELGRALVASPQILILEGELGAASEAVAQLASVQEILGIKTASYAGMGLLAYRGQEAEARALIEATIRGVASRGEGTAIGSAEYSRAVLSNGCGEYADALDAAQRASAHGELVHENLGLSEVVEAASRVGDVTAAKAAVDRIGQKAQATQAPWALGIHSRSTALLAGDTAEPHFLTALGLLGSTRIRTELARTHLLFGEWLRRASRRVDARRELQTALEMFEGMGMAAFAERARRELAGTGATVRPHGLRIADELTSQEIQIARLARDGLSNAEIGAQLFLSARTVEWHLRNIFSKLEITSRKQLRSRWTPGTARRADQGSPDGPVLG